MKLTPYPCSSAHLKTSSFLRPPAACSHSLLASVVLALLTPSAAVAQWTKVTGLPDPFNPSDVAIAPDGTVFTCGTAENSAQSGFYRSANGGSSWTRQNAGMTDQGGNEVAPWRIGAYSEVTLAATNGSFGIYRSSNSGGSWGGGGLGVGSAFWDFCRYNADTYFVTKRENVVGNSGVWRSLDRGASWQRTSTGLYGLTLPVVGDVITTEAVTLHNGKLFCGVSTTGVFRSTNAGDTWTPLSGNVYVENTVVGPLTSCWDLASTGPRLFANIQNYSQVFMTEDDGDTWRQVTTGLGNFSQRLASDNGVLYVPQGNGRLYFTTDGKSWQYYPETGLPGGVQPFLAVKHGTAAYFTTASGLYKLNLSAATALNIAPVVTQQPVGGLRLVGQSYTFTVNANGTGPFTYQWLKNGAEISGATSASYTRGPLTLTDADNYSCRVGGPGGTTTSTEVALAVIAETPGTIDPLFDTGIPIVNSTAAVNSIILPASGRLWTAGSYVQRLGDAGGAGQAANRLTTYTGNPLRFSTDGGIPSGAVNVLLPLAGGKVLAGGTFTAAGGNPGTATKYLARYNADGTFDNTFIAPSTTGTGAVTALAQDPVTQKIYVAGTFLDWGGDSVRDYLIRLNSDGSLDGSFTSAAMVTNPQLAALSLAPDGKLYVGGNFFGVNIGGNSNFNYVNIVRLNLDGTVDTTFPVTNTTVPGRVVAFSALPDGRLYVACNPGGDQIKNIQRLLPNASPDPSFSLPAAAGGINTIALQPDGKLLVGGTFTTFAGTATPGKTIRLRNTGAIDTSVTYAQPGTDTSRNVMGFVVTSNRLYVAQFRGGANGVRRYFNDLTEPSFVAPPQSQNVNAGQPATLRAYVYATQAVTYQWYKDGVLIPGATTDTLAFNALTTGDTGSYTVVVTHPFGPVTSAPAVVRALAAPQLGSPAPSVTQLGNRPLTLAPDVFGQAPLTFQWLKNGTPIVNNSPTGGGGFFTGTATAVLNITGLHENDNAVYTLRVTNSMGTLDVPITVTALSQAGYLPLDYVGSGGLISVIRDAGDNRFFVLGTGGLNTWNGAPVSAQMMRIKADNTVDATFAPAAFTTAANPPNNVTYASDAQLLANGQVLVWGSFVNAGGIPRPGMARLNPNGSVDAGFLANNGTAPNGGQLRKVLELRDGRLLVAGGFTTWGASGAFTGYTGLVCLDSNGSVNTDFMNAFGAAPNGPVSDMDLLPDGRIVLCGSFTTIGGVNRSNMAVLELNGAVSAGFVPPAFTNGAPDDIMALPDGRVMAGGVFTGVTGSPQLEGWVVLNANGTRDATVDTSGVNGIPYPAFGRDANGGILVVGVQGSGLRRFTGNFVPDNNFLPVENNISGFNGINFIVPLSSGRIVIRYGGATYQGRSISSAVILRGYELPVGFITQPVPQNVDLGGTVTLSVTPTGTSPVSLQWLKDGVEIPGQSSASLTISGASRSDSAVYSVRATNVTGGTVTSSGARVIVLAEPVFTAISSSRTQRVGDTVTISATAIGVQPIAYQWLKNGSNIPGATSATLTLPTLSLNDAASYSCAASNLIQNVAAVTVSPPVHISVAGGTGGSLDPAFPVTLTGFAGAKVESLMLEPNGEIVLAGSPQLLNTYHYAARYKADGVKTGSFTANSGTGASLPSCNGAIYKIARDPATGKYVAVGAFTILGGANRARIGRVTPDFLADATFAPGTGFTETGAFTSQNGAALVVDASSRIYVGGSFTTYNGETVSKLIRLLPGGTRDASFNPPAFNNSVYSLMLVGDKLLVGGDFTQIAGVAGPPLVRLNSDGTRDDTFTSALTAGVVFDLASGPEGDIVVAGSGTVAGNSQVHRLNPDGSRETTFNAGSTINQAVRAVAVQQDGKVFIAGQFSQVNAQPRSKVAKLNADGTLDTAWNPGTGATAGSPGYIYDLALGANGILYLGGDFLTYNGETRQFIAGVNGTTASRAVVSLPAPPAAVLGQPLTLGAAATGVAFASQPYLKYQWLKDDQELPGQTAQTLTLASYSNSDAGRYTVRVIDAGGTSTSSPVDLPQVGAGFSAWASVLPAGQRDPEDDYDADGVPNILEYALDLNPLNSSSNALPPLAMTATHLTLTYRRARADIIYSVEASGDISAWSAANVNQGTPAGDGTTTASIPLTAPEDFLRLRVTLVP